MVSSLASLNKYFWKYRRHFFFGLLFILLTNYFRILSPQLTGYVVNSVVKGISGSIAANGEKEVNFLLEWLIGYFEQLSFSEKIMATGLTLVITAIISGFFMYLMRQTIIVMSRHIEFDQKNEIYQHYQSLDASFYKIHRTGDLMNRISEDVSRVRMYTGPAVMYIANLAAVIGFSIYFMWQSDIQLTLIALSPLPLLAITIYKVNTIIHRKSEKIQSELGNLTTAAQESYSGIRVIKSFVQEKDMMGFFKSGAEEYRRSALSLATTESLYFPSIGLLIGLSTLLTVLFAALNVIHQEPGASVGKIAEFVMYIQMLTFPVSAIGWTASMVQRAATSQQRINEFLLQQPAIKDSKEAVAHRPQGQINFRKVCFTYSHTKIQALKDFNLEIKAGEKIAILGKTGSGKSTVSSLLLRMFEPQQGEISLDGIPVNHIRLSSLREGISYVPQDVFLFSDSIRNNIKFGDGAANEDAVIKAAEQAAILEDIEGFPSGFETQVGERGISLSGGQKQRVSLARALLKESNILILDDCLSAVDTKTERKIAASLKKALEGKTAIVITHRILSSIEFDKIIIMEDGRIVEQGKHEELIKNQGIYADIFRRQQDSDKGKTGLETD
jgi:ATP-binding cassette subfamily B protein